MILVLFCLVVLALLCRYAFRNRSAPGAVPFVVMTGLIMIWILANGLWLTGTEENVRLFWFKVRGASMLPIITSGFVFSLDYAGLGRWIDRVTLTILTIPAVLVGFLMMTNDAHHLIWTRIILGETIHVDRSPIAWGFVGYAYLLTLLQLGVLVRLFLTSPRHRWIAAGLIGAPFIIRGAFVLTLAGWHPPVPIDPMTVAAFFAAMPYAVAVFHHHMFYVVPIARDTVIETMPIGLMVLDLRKRVVDMNARARDIFGIDRARIFCHPLYSVLAPHPELLRFLQKPDQTGREMTIGEKTGKWYHVSQSLLIDIRGYCLGSLVWLYDVSEQKKLRDRFVDEQKTLAMLNERELLARELHDGIGQMMAAADLQTASAKILIENGNISGVKDCLHRLEEITLATKKTIREYLAGVNSAVTILPDMSDPGLPAAVKNYIHYFNRNSGIETSLFLPPDLEPMVWDPSIEVQILPIIQEALTNIKKHARATKAQVVLAPFDQGIRVTIEDNGQGFNPGTTSVSPRFGIRSMQGRAHMIGARFNITSAPGTGTRVIIEIPWKKEANENITGG